MKFCEFIYGMYSKRIITAETAIETLECELKVKQVELVLELREIKEYLLKIELTKVI